MQRLALVLILTAICGMGWNSRAQDEDSSVPAVDPSQQQIVTTTYNSDPSQYTTCPSSFDDIIANLDKDSKACEDIHDATTNCCSDYTTCSASAMTTMAGGSDMQKLMMMMMTVEYSQLRAQSSPGQMQDMGSLCQMFGGITGQGAAVNNGVNTTCIKDKNQCSQICQKNIQHWERQYSALHKVCANDQTGLISGITSVQSRMKSWESQCDDATPSKVITAQTNNLNGVNQGSMQNVCSQLQAQQQQAVQLQPLAPPQQQVDCSNPVLSGSQACGPCAAAIAMGQPCTAPAQAIRDGGMNASFTQSPLTVAGTAGNFNINTPYGQIRQGVHFPDAPKQGANLPQDPNAMNPMMMGSGMAMLGAGSSGNFNPLAAPQSINRGGAVYGHPINTDILKGERGGNGYTQNNMQVDTSGGGYAGYPTAEAGTPRANIDLRKYLPGHSMDPNRRVAGVGAATPDIASSNGTDIFKRISDRFKLICSSNRLIDCVLPKRPE